MKTRAKKIILRTLLGIFIVFVLFIGLFIVPYFANIVMPWDKANAIEAALEWGGLAELPKNADITVKTRGSMFSRQFVIEFSAASIEIDEWIKKSKRLKDIVPANEEYGKFTFEIRPGEEGSVGGTVTIDQTNNRVAIDMSWG